MTPTNTPRPPDLPDFSAPPVVEVAFAVRFEPLGKLTAAELGRLWSERYAEFPATADEPVLPPEIENLADAAGLFRFNFRFGIGPMAPGARVVLSDPASEHIIQLQNDLFGTNWRKQQNEYPRFDNLAIRFEDHFTTFHDFLAVNDFGQVDPTQCELTYVNQLVVPDEGLVRFGSLPHMLNVLSPPSSELRVLNQAEDFRLSFRYLMRDPAERPLGRLYLNVSPWRPPGETRSVYLMTLAAKGPPQEKTVQGVLQFFQNARSWIVKGFAEATTPTMHQIWGRRQ